MAVCAHPFILHTKLYPKSEHYMDDLRTSVKGCTNGRGYRVRKVMLILGAAALLTGTVGALVLSAQPSASVNTRVQAVQPQVKDLVDRVTAPASIVVYREIEVRSQAGGLGMALLVHPGDEVKSGEILARIQGEVVNADIRRTENELAQAIAVAARLHFEAKAGPEQARARVRSAELGVQQAEADLASIRQSVQWQSSSAESRLAQARVNVEMLQSKMETGEVSDTELEMALQQLAVAQAEVTALNPERSSQIIEATLRVEAALHALEQARVDAEAAVVLPEQLAAADMAAAVAEEALSKARRNVAGLEIKAPVNGVVLEVPGRDGQLVQPGTLIAVLGQADVRLARARVDELDITKVLVGQAAVIRSSAFPADLFRGEVRRVAPRGTGTSAGTRAVYEVDIEFEDPTGRLRSDMGVDTEIAVSPHKGALTVPAEALRESGGERFVWIIEDGKARRQSVVVGLIVGGDMEILKGPGTDSLVIVGPADLLTSLKDGQLVAMESSGG